MAMVWTRRVCRAFTSRFGEIEFNIFDELLSTPEGTCIGGPE